MGHRDCAVSALIYSKPPPFFLTSPIPIFVNPFQIKVITHPPDSFLPQSQILFGYSFFVGGGANIRTPQDISFRMFSVVLWFPSDYLSDVASWPQWYKVWKEDEYIDI